MNDAIQPMICRYTRSVLQRLTRLAGAVLSGRMPDVARIKRESQRRVAPEAIGCFLPIRNHKSYAEPQSYEMSNKEGFYFVVLFRRDI